MQSNQKESIKHLVNFTFSADEDLEKTLLTEIRNKLRPYMHNDDVEVLAIDIGFNSWREEDSVNSIGITVQISKRNEKDTPQDK